MYGEKTPLCATPYGPNSPYSGFVANPHRGAYKRKKLINCICLLILAIFPCALIIAIIYSSDPSDIEDTFEDSNSSFPSLMLSPANQGSLNENDIKEAFKIGYENLRTKDEMDEKNPAVALNSPSYKHQLVLKSSNEAMNLTRIGFVMNRATKYLIEKHPVMKNSLPDIPFPRNWSELSYCKKEIYDNCDMKYRTINGSCNNKLHPSYWGVSMRPFARSLPPDYCDAVSSPRCSKSGGELPSPREITLTLHRPEFTNDPKFTHMFAVWGQFVDHDLTATALNKGKDGKSLACCGEQKHPECFPVSISKVDPYYKKFNVTCMEFVRSAPAPTCNLGPREQLNQASSFLDGSVVYGNNDKLAQKLRTFQGGLLKMHQTEDGRELLPVSTNKNDGCNQDAEIKKGRYCFMSGDSRANENLHLTTIHLIMARQHNSMARKLSNLNPEWDDETIYQESRRIVVAQMQHITYKELLEPLLGEETMKKYNLNVGADNYMYDENEDPTINNNFAAAAFRFAHTLLPKLMNYSANINNQSSEYVLLHKMLFNPFKLYETGSLDMALESAIDTRAEKLNRFFNKEVTQHLFEANNSTEMENKTCGLDLVSLNLQRGRDHGLPSYIKWREHCGSSHIESFDDLENIMDKDSIKILKNIYSSVDDIDLYSGALSEKPVDGAILGSTATCLIAEQFRKLKTGDRYWYETDDQPQAFTKEQLREIQKTTLAKVICNNADAIDTIRKNVMEIYSSENDAVLCSELDDLDISYWKDPMAKNETELILKGKTPADIVKLYASTIVIAGTAMASLNGEDPIEIFDGSLPTTIHLDGIVDPNAFDESIDIEISAIAPTNTSLVGNFRLPVKSVNNSIVETKYWNVNFSVEVTFKWGGSLDIIEPKKIYKCKVMFTKFLSSTFTLKGKTVKPDESCTIQLGGSFYQRPFYCFLTPWWCSNEKLYFWSGTAEIILRKRSVPNELKQAVSPTGKDVKKPFVSGNVVSGNATAVANGHEPVTIFDGTLPVVINVDSLIDPNSFKKTTIVEWSGVVNNNTITGKFSIEVDNVTWVSDFTVDMDFPNNYSNSLDIIKPNKKYECKLLFLSLTKSSLKTAGEGCTIKLTGYYYSKPFYCFLTPWWCSDENLFYWTGGVQLSIQTPMLTMLKSQENSVMGFFNVNAHKLDGTVAGGWLKVDGQYIWNGEIPAKIEFPVFWTPNTTGAEDRMANFTHGLIWSCSIFQNTIRGSFQFPKYTKNNQISWTNGEFFVQIEPIFANTLYDILIPGVSYVSPVHFHDMNSTLLNYMSENQLDFINRKIYINNRVYGLKSPLILLGTHSKNRKQFIWNGQFILKVNRIPLYHRI